MGLSAFALLCVLCVCVCANPQAARVDPYSDGVCVCVCVCVCVFACSLCVCVCLCVCVRVCVDVLFLVEFSRQEHFLMTAGLPGPSKGTDGF